MCWWISLHFRKHHQQNSPTHSLTTTKHWVLSWQKIHTGTQHWCLHRARSREASLAWFFSSVSLSWWDLGVWIQRIYSFYQMPEKTLPRQIVRSRRKAPTWKHNTSYTEKWKVLKEMKNVKRNEKCLGVYPRPLDVLTLYFHLACSVHMLDVCHSHNPLKISPPYPSCAYKLTFCSTFDTLGSVYVAIGRWTQVHAWMNDDDATNANSMEQNECSPQRLFKLWTGWCSVQISPDL